MILSLHIRTTRNAGDLWSNPLLYFRPQERVQFEDAVEFQDGEANERCRLVITGGGAIFGKRWNPTNGPLVAWGSGHTTRNLGRHDPVPDKEQIEQYRLIGSRDECFGHWTPCASCMHPLFDNPPDPVVPVVHYSAEFATGRSMRACVEHLAAGETIVSSSYHGLYWGALLGRKLVGIPFGSKFYHLGFEFPKRLESKWDTGLEEARTAPAWYLKVCREANVDFARQVFRFAEIPYSHGVGLTGEFEDLDRIDLEG